MKKLEYALLAIIVSTMMLKKFTELPAETVLVGAIGTLALMYQSTAPSIFLGIPIGTSFKNILFKRWGLFRKIEFEDFQSIHIKITMYWGVSAAIALVAILFQTMNYPGVLALWYIGFYSQLLFGLISGYLMATKKDPLYQQVFLRCIFLIVLMGFASLFEHPPVLPPVE